MPHVRRSRQVPWSQVFDPIWDLNVSIYAKGLYAFLCRCTNNETGEAWPSYATIRDKCSIGSDTTVNKALKELESVGMVERRQRFRENSNAKTSNVYYIHQEPTTSQPSNIKLKEALTELGLSTPTVEEVLHHVEKGSTAMIERVLHLLTNPSTERGENKELLIENNLIERERKTKTPSLSQEKQKPKPKPKQKTSRQRHGEFGHVKLTREEHRKLQMLYGNSVAADYITRLDTHIEASGRQYQSHYAVILRWMSDDEMKKNGTNLKMPREIQAENLAKFKAEYPDEIEEDDLE